MMTEKQVSLFSLHSERKEKESYTENSILSQGKNYPVVVLGVGVVSTKSVLGTY
jgi:hypothetical protein